MIKVFLKIELLVGIWENFRVLWGGKDWYVVMIWYDMIWLISDMFCYF